jgi:hypothetical protein
MSPPKTVHGARCQVIIADPNTGTAGVVGLFNSISYGLAFDVQDVFLLGRYSADETVYTAQETVNVSASGFRVVGQGPHKGAHIPALQTLLNHEYLQLAVYDRQTNQLIAKISNVRPTGFSTTINARQLEEISVSFKGILVSDEDTENAEPVGSSTLP